jgi:hypothetical protein
MNHKTRERDQSNYLAVLKYSFILLVLTVSLKIFWGVPILSVVFNLITNIGGSVGDLFVFHYLYYDFDYGFYYEEPNYDGSNYEGSKDCYMMGEGGGNNGNNLGDWTTEELQETRGQVLRELKTNPNLSSEDKRNLEDLYETMDKEIYDRAMAESRAAAEEKYRLGTIIEESEGEGSTKEESSKRGTKRSLGSTFQDDFVEKKEDLYDDDEDKKSKKPRNK